MEKALELVRKEYPNDLVWYGFEFDGKFWFGLTKGKEYVPLDVSMFGVCVDKNECRVEHNYWRLIGANEKFAEAWNNRTKIDVKHDY